MDSDEYYYCGKVGGVNMKLHDEIKEKYERGDYDQQIKTTQSDSNLNKLDWYYKIRKQVFIVWILLLVANFALQNYYTVSHNLEWFHFTLLTLVTLNTGGLIYCIYKINKLKNSTQPK